MTHCNLNNVTNIRRMCYIYIRGMALKTEQVFQKPYYTSTKLHCATSKQAIISIFIYFTHLESCKATLSYLSLVVKTSYEGHPDQKFRLLEKKKKH